MGDMTIDVDVEDVLDGLDALAQAAVTAARPAAQAAAQAFYDEVRRRVPVADRARTDQGRPRTPGTLRDAIYQVYSRDQSRPEDALAVYHVSWNKSRAPHGHLVEFGHKYPFAVRRDENGRVWTDVRTPSADPGAIKGRRPFVRPAYDAVRNEAMQAARERLLDEVRQKMGGGT